MIDVKDLEAWVGMLHDFQSVERKVIPPGRDHRENDVEHSYTLAMTAWYLNEAYELGMSSSTILMYALTHDLAEVYAGDPLPIDEAAMSVKPKLEAAALKRLGEEFPGAYPIWWYARQYEARDTEECRFVYALDKIMPRLMVVLGATSLPLLAGEKLGCFDEVVRQAVTAYPLLVDVYRRLSVAVYERLGEPLPEWVTETGGEG